MKEKRIEWWLPNVALFHLRSFVNLTVLILSIHLNYRYKRNDILIKRLKDTEIIKNL